MEETSYSRKLEKTGRLMIPIKLREEMNMVSGKEYHFFKYIDEDGRRFVCIDCGLPDTQMTVEQAIQIIQARGLKIVEDDD